VFWDPIEAIRVGLEYLYGRRYNKGGQSGDATRLQFMTYFTF
jgi:hypothetical protein